MTAAATTRGTSEEERGEEHLRRIGLVRECNCLLDVDRNTRRRALTKIKKVLVEDRVKVSLDANAQFCRDQSL